MNLSSDEERERKAEYRDPGTFNVVLNLQSFVNLPEYTDPTSTRNRRSSVQSIGSHMPGVLPGTESTVTPIDPNTVLLRRFEDATTTSTSPSIPGSSSTQTPLQSSLPETMPPMTPIQTFTSNVTGTASFDAAIAQNGPDARYLVHYRTFVVRQLALFFSNERNGSQQAFGQRYDMFEEEAARFPPLYHAVCALSALSLAQQNQVPLAEAIQHYDRASTLLRSSITSAEDRLADCVFFWHFLLLIYDICAPVQQAAEPLDSKPMWVGQMDSLLQIAMDRRNRAVGEPYPFIVWWICLVDIYACLGGSGSGDFTQKILQSNMFPPALEQLPLLWPNQAARFYPEELEIFPQVLELNHGVVLAAANLGLLARQIRMEAETTMPSTEILARRQQHIIQIQQEFHNVWRERCPTQLSPSTPYSSQHLPWRVQMIFEHAYLLYHASLLYSHTSIYPHQRLHLPAASTPTQLQTHTTAILTLAQTLLSTAHPPPPRRFLVFPLFLAGIATADPDAKLLAAALIRQLEASGIGGNAARTRELLLAVYEAQRRCAERGGGGEEVDWMEVARGRGVALVDFGM
ncbi:hypothetical protein LTR66_004082 [Elasticomyces elasticus]|nr:hypothetical protein LTR66_004082 [Elasticomyces elasticus]